MKLYKIYESLLSENNAEACIKKLGYELFSDELGGNEKNTPVENRFVDAIFDFTDNAYGEELTPDFIEMVKTLKACMNQYPEVLLPDDTIIYRGTVIPLKYFVINKQPINIKSGNEYIYRAYSTVQSWTTNHDVANDFGRNTMIDVLATEIDPLDYNTSESRKELLKYLIDVDLRISFTLVHRTNPNDFLFKDKYFSRLSANGYESEVIRINNGPLKLVAYINFGTNKISYKTIQLIDLINRGILGE